MSNENNLIPLIFEFIYIGIFFGVLIKLINVGNKTKQKFKNKNNNDFK